MLRGLTARLKLTLDQMFATAQLTSKFMQTMQTLKIKFDQIVGHENTIINRTKCTSNVQLRRKSGRTCRVNSKRHSALLEARPRVIISFIQLCAPLSYCGT